MRWRLFRFRLNQIVKGSRVPLAPSDLRPGNEKAWMPTFVGMTNAPLGGSRHSLAGLGQGEFLLP